MPLIQMPSVNMGRHPDESEDLILTLPYDGVNLRLYNPNRVVHISPGTEDQFVINRGIGDRWQLSVTFGEVESGTELADEYEGWLSDMHDLGNYSELPLGRSANPVSLLAASPTISSKSGNTFTLSSALTGMKRNQFVRVGSRLAQLKSVNHAAAEYTWKPLIGGTGDYVDGAKTFLGRMLGDGSYEGRTADGGFLPMTMQFQEVI